MQPILPGATLGMLGGGQLGRMFVTAARTLGYEVIVLDPDPDSPAGSMATRHLQAAYDETEALDVLARECAVITTEFENIPAETLTRLAGRKPVHPSANALSIAQNRIREKTFVQSLDLNTSRFIALESDADLAQCEDFNYPAILKTATLGYDGKGQVVCDNAEQAVSAFHGLNCSCILEQRIDLAKEVSVVLARNLDGQISCYPIAENSHANGILDVSLVPARIEDNLAKDAIAAASKIAEGMDYVGVLAVEFFVSTAGELLVNEMAPRPHNSGHYTLDACDCCQFEQQVRMVCNLPAGSTGLNRPVAMLNLLGNIWPEEGAPAWQEVLAQVDAHLHLYGKKQARPGRKMGHINFLGANVEQASDLLEQTRSRLF